MAKLNIQWPQFAVCNDNQTTAFEDMCRRLFTAEFLKNKQIPHANHNNAGIEVLPILEPERDDGKPQRRISFQCKYTEQPSYAYAEFQKSAKATVKEYKGKLDLVYLFCNKTLTTTTKGYQSIVKIHADAGIETVPISNDEILDMVVRHSDIAEYFFQRRIVTDTTGLQVTVINGIPVYMIPSDRSASESYCIENEALLKELVAEKLTDCKNYALGLELDSLKSEVEKLLTLGVDNGGVHYYQFLILLHSEGDFDEALSRCYECDRTEAEWLMKFYLNPTPLTVDEFKKHTPITQIFAIDKLFVSEHWSELIELYDAVGNNVDPSIQMQFDLYYGLSLLNLQENEKAQTVLHNLYDRTKEQRILFYEKCARIKMENAIYQASMAVHHDDLAELIAQLDSFRELKCYSRQELFVAVLRMESFYHLGMEDKAYLEQAISEFDEFIEDIKTNTIIRYYYALCLELNGNRDRAIKVYENLDWKSDLAIAERFMVCLVLAGKPRIAIAVHEALDQKSARTEAIYLMALDRSGDGRYKSEFQRIVQEFGNKNLVDMLQVAYFTDDDKLSRDIIVPALRKLINENALNGLLFYQKIEMLAFLAHSNEIELVEMTLETIVDISMINNFCIGEIYRSLFSITNKEYANDEITFKESKNLDAAERIADRFLERNVSRRNFLQIKMICAAAKKMPYSALKYSKELFEITHETEVARSIVALLFERKETSPEVYAPYLEVLKKSDKPDHCLVTAYAMLAQGKESEADFYVYKAIYLLNSEDDYLIYRSYCGFYSCNLHRYGEDTTIRSVRGSVVITLEDSGNDRLVICLDPEADFSDEGNRSMGVEHLIPSNADYIKLRNCGLGQALHFRDKKYKIVQIMPRSQYVQAVIFWKIQEHPEMFSGVVRMIATENIDDMIKQVRELTDNSDKIKSLLRSYHFEQNEIGLPIDAICLGDYGRYITAFNYLLYQKNEAFYAGPPIYEDETGQKYVPGLATIMLLAVIHRLDVLDAIKNNIIIPESYISFFCEEYSKAAEKIDRASFTLNFSDDNAVMKTYDRSVPEIWEAILNFCQSCKTMYISDQERIDFKIADGLTGERLIAGLRLSIIHLDALLLVQREKVTYLCDDLFFRKIATWMGVRNLNIVSLVQHFGKMDYMVPIIKELYLHTTGGEDGQGICRNIE